MVSEALGAAGINSGQAAGGGGRGSHDRQRPKVVGRHRVVGQTVKVETAAGGIVLSTILPRSREHEHLCSGLSELGGGNCSNGSTAASTSSLTSCKKY